MYGNAETGESAQDGAMGDDGLMAQVRTKTFEKERGECAALQYAVSFHCLLEGWKDCEELKPHRQGKWIFMHKRKGIERSGVLRRASVDA